MEYKRPSRPFVVGKTTIPIPVPFAAPSHERAIKRLEMMAEGMMPIPIGLERAPRETLEKLGIKGVEYSYEYNERYTPLITHKYE